MTRNTLIAIDKSKSFRVYLTGSTAMVSQAARVHQATPLAAAALGRTLTGAGLMGLMLLKNEQAKITVQIKGEGPAAEILVTANRKGQVKGYIANPAVDLPLRNDGKLDVGGAVGIGTLTVIRDSGQKEPYVGRIDLVSGEIADDLTAYFFISEQQSTSVALGVKIAQDYSVCAAGGMIIQMLPDAEEGAVTALEQMLEKLGSFSDLVEQNPGVDELLKTVFTGVPLAYQPEVLEYHHIGWQCDCSEERLEGVLISLGEDELKAIIKEEGHAELVCQFCTKKYHFNREKLEGLWKESRKKMDGSTM